MQPRGCRERDLSRPHHSPGAIITCGARGYCRTTGRWHYDQGRCAETIRDLRVGGGFGDAADLEHAWTARTRDAMDKDANDRPPPSGASLPIPPTR